MQQNNSAFISTLSEINRRVRSSLGLKLMVIGFLVAVLLIPMGLISQLVSERQERQESAVTEISSMWAGSQHIAGPILTIPYQVHRIDKDDRQWTEKAYFHILPDQLQMHCTLEPEMRYRGIYNVAVYRSDMNINATFSDPSKFDADIAKSDILFDQAFISMGVSDVRGIDDDLKAQWNEQSISFNSGLESNDVLRSGVQAAVAIPKNVDSSAPIRFTCQLHVRGSRDLRFSPIAKRTEVTLSSPWTNPSFNGAFLPSTRNITSKGFEAQWTILHLNRSYPQRWSGSKYTIEQSEFGMSLLNPVDDYSKTDRSIKYAVLIVGLTFLIYFFVELRHKTTIFAVQYLLVGFALCIFYILLLSLTEHLSFNISYLIASVMTISIITWYSQAMLRQRRLSIVVGACLSMLYALLFSILQLQDYALLAGSFTLFVILAIIMHYSKTIFVNVPIAVAKSPEEGDEK